MHLNRRLGFAFSLPLMAVAFSACETPNADVPEVQEVSGKIDWVYDYEQGKRLSRSTEKPMFVVFRCER